MFVTNKPLQIHVCCFSLSHFPASRLQGILLSVRVAGSLRNGTEYVLNLMLYGNDTKVLVLQRALYQILNIRQS